MLYQSNQAIGNIGSDCVPSTKALLVRVALWIVAMTNNWSGIFLFGNERFG